MTDSGRILIVDSDAPSRKLIAGLLGKAGYTCIEVPDSHDALPAARRELPALVVVAVVLDGMTGYDVCRALRVEFGELLPIIFVSDERTSPLDSVAGLLLGADDYITAPFAGEELVARVRRAVTRVEALHSNRRSTSNELTARELEVLGLLADGLTQDEIAGELVISPKTVATHIQRILAKLGVHSRAAAVARAYRTGILQDARLPDHAVTAR